METKAAIFITLKKFVHLLMNISDIVPKKYRYTLVDKQIEHVLECIRFASDANIGLKQKRIDNVTNLLARIETVNILSQILIETKHHKDGGYVFILPKNCGVQVIEYIHSIKKQSISWRNWLDKNLE